MRSRQDSGSNYGIVPLLTWRISSRTIQGLQLRRRQQYADMVVWKQSTDLRTSGEQEYFEHKHRKAEIRLARLTPPAGN
ncbi:hypothetical protein NEUTE2DRAFT_157491 [Neurospora tetrasperma FGSC 2509]|nr:hypothetical protein NEUTE2DRAFT_157491 [Neurospora tetrasperma FGSC 2509]